MNSYIGYEYFVNIILPPLILFFGLFGNIIGLAVLSRKKLIQIGPVHVYRFLLTIDSVYLVLIIQKYVQFGFNIPFNKISSLICKLSSYFNYSLCSISPMLLVYISIDRFIFIKFSNKTLRDKHLQVILVYFFDILFLIKNTFN
jgi:hypothetical protein